MTGSWTHNNDAHHEAEKLMTASDVAAYLQVSAVTVYTLIKEQGLPAFKLGRQYRIPRAQFETWLAGRAVPSEPGDAPDG
jgi:putative molybdopterin biosynthesis protein